MHCRESEASLVSIESQVVSENVTEPLSCKVTYVALCVLLHYGGHMELSLQDWFSSLRSGLPELTDARVLQDLFRRLSAEGVVELRSRPPIYGATTTKSDGLCPLQGKFSTTLTAEGVSMGRQIMISGKLRMNARKI